MPDIRSLTGTAGELLCASYLAFRGMNVYRPMTPSRRDLLIYNPDKNFFYGVQVKTQRGMNEPDRKDTRYRFSFFKRGRPYSTFDVPIFCMVSSDLQLMIFDINDGSKDSYNIKEHEFTKARQCESFDELMSKLHYHD